MPRPPRARGYIGSSSSSLSVSLSRSSVPHIGRDGAGFIGDGAIGGRPGVNVPSVVCSVAGAAGAARRLFAAGRPAARFVAPVRREAARAREDVPRFAAPPRFRVVARLVRERVPARFFRRVLLAIVGPPLVEWDAKSWLGCSDVRGPSTGLMLFLSQRADPSKTVPTHLRRPRSCEAAPSPARRAKSSAAPPRA
jgi:hypothetical protein